MENYEKLKPYLIDIDTLKVNDKVFSIPHGEGIVNEIHLDDVGCAIRIKFPSRKTLMAYTKQGKYLVSELLPSLFKSNPFESEYPKEMEVSTDNYHWYPRIVIAEVNNRVVTIQNSESTNVSTWTYWRKPQIIETFTIEEVAKALGKNPLLIKIEKDGKSI